MVGAERLREVDRIVAAVHAWAVTDEQVHAVAVVGSYAAGRPRMSSDLDLVIVASAPKRLLPDIDCVSAAVGVHAAPVRERDWGRLRERRFRTPTGLDIDWESWRRPGSGRQLILEPHASCETAVRSSLIRRA